MKAAVSVVLAVCLSTAAHAGELQRRVKAQTITSAEAPKARLTFDKAFRYAGGQSFELYGVANAEQHFFVDAGKDGSKALVERAQRSLNIRR